MIKRYIWNLEGDGCMHPFEHGEWVEYQDHLAELALLRDKLEKAEKFIELAFVAHPNLDIDIELVAIRVAEGTTK